MFCVSMPNLVTSAALVETATKCFAIAFSSPSASRLHFRALCALVMVSSVVKVFEEMMNSVSAGVEIARRLDEVGAIDVGDEAHGQIAIAVVAQRLVGHHRSQVRAADSDVDDVADALAGVALPRAVAHAAAERRHPVEHLVNLGHHVFAVGHDRRAARRAQRHVQNGAPLGDVDLLAREHRVDAPAQPRLLGQRQQQTHRLGGDAMLGVVEIQPGGLERKALAALRIFAEERAQMNVANLLVMLAQRLPGRPLCEPRRFGLHRSVPLFANQLAFLSAALLSAMQASRSSHDLTKASAPSR